MCVCVCVIVCDLETSTIRRSGSELGCCSKEGGKKEGSVKQNVQFGRTALTFFPFTVYFRVPYDTGNKQRIIHH
jgi:hypothetical protein